MIGEIQVRARVKVMMCFKLWFDEAWGLRHIFFGFSRCWICLQWFVCCACPFRSPTGDIVLVVVDVASIWISAPHNKLESFPTPPTHRHQRRHDRIFSYLMMTLDLQTAWSMCKNMIMRESRWFLWKDCIRNDTSSPSKNHTFISSLTSESEWYPIFGLSSQLMFTTKKVFWSHWISGSALCIPGSWSTQALVLRSWLNQLFDWQWLSIRYSHLSNKLFAFGIYS